MSDDNKFLSGYKFAIWDKASSIQPTIRDVKANGIIGLYSNIYILYMFISLYVYVYHQTY